MTIDLASIPEHKRSPGEDGYVYVLEFSTGIVKVGKTRNPRARIATHVDDARKFGATVDQLWLSEWHENYSENERLLLHVLGAGSVEHGNEYLRVNFSDAVELAKGLTFRVLTEPERTARDEASRLRSEKFARSLLGMDRGRRYTIDVNDELTAAVLRTVFSGVLPESIGQPDDRQGVRDRVTQFAKESGREAEEILNWSYIEVITHLAETVVKTGCLDLHIAALKSERYDLTHQPFFGGAA